MRTFAIAVTGTLISAALPASVSARAADNWSLRNLDDPPGKPCVTAPLDHCLRGLIAGGGVCAREHGGARGAGDDRVRMPQRDGRRERRDRWNW